MRIKVGSYRAKNGTSIRIRQSRGIWAVDENGIALEIFDGSLRTDPIILPGGVPSRETYLLSYLEDGTPLIGYEDFEDFSVAGAARKSPAAFQRLQTNAPQEETTFGSLKAGEGFIVDSQKPAVMMAKMHDGWANPYYFGPGTPCCAVKLADDVKVTRIITEWPKNTDSPR